MVRDYVPRRVALKVIKFGLSYSQVFGLTNSTLDRNWYPYFKYENEYVYRYNSTSYWRGGTQGFRYIWQLTNRGEDNIDALPNNNIELYYESDYVDSDTGNLILTFKFNHKVKAPSIQKFD